MESIRINEINEEQSKKILMRSLMMPLALCICCIITILISTAVITRKIYHKAEIDMAASIDKQADSVKVALEGQYALLKSQADVFCRYGLSSDNKQKSEWLSAIVKSSSFSHVILANDKGEAVMENGTHINIGDRAYFRSAMSGERVFELLRDTRFDDGCDTIIGVPVSVDGKTVAVLLGAYQAKQVFHLLIQHADAGGDLLRDNGRQRKHNNRLRRDHAQFSAQQRDTPAPQTGICGRLQAG